jgi:hypothetical protein
MYTRCLVMTLYTTSVARQRIHNTHQKTNLKAMFSTRFVRQLSDATIEAMFSVPSVPRWYKRDKPTVYLVVRQFPGSKVVNTNAEEATDLEAVIRQRLVKTQHTEKT